VGTTNTYAQDERCRPMASGNSGVSTQAGIDRARAGLIEVRQEGSRTVLATGPRYVGRQRLQARLVGAAMVVAGAILTPVFWWAILAAAAGGAFILFASFVIQSRPLLVIHDDQRLEPLSPGLAASVRLAQVSRIEGKHELHGWDPQSVIYAVLSDGRREALVIFRGTDDALSIEACRALGAVVRKPAQFTNQYGQTTDSETA